MSSAIINQKFEQGSLTREPDLFSDDSWNLLLFSEENAKRWRHGQLDVEHIIHTLFSSRDYQKFVSELPINNSELLDQVEDFLSSQAQTQSNNLFIGDALEDLLINANNFRSRWGSRLIEISHLILALGRDDRIGCQLFKNLGLPSAKLEAELRRTTISNSQTQSKQEKVIEELNKNQVPPSKSQKSYIKKTNSFDQEEIQISNDIDFRQIEKEPSALQTYGRDLTAEAMAGELDPVIGRGGEIQTLIKVLSRRGKNNPVLIGPSGVGKTVIAELLAQKIVAGEVPESLKDLRLISLELGALIAGAKFRGQFEERFRAVLAEVSNPDSGVVLFIDELHTIINSERSGPDAGNLLKPVLAKGDLRVIGATTSENYGRTVEKDQALNRLFQQVLIKEPSLTLSLEILKGIKNRYELHHGVTISKEALITANRLADRYISDRCLPDKAIDLIDEAAAQLKMELTSKPKVIEDEESRLKTLESKLIALENLNEDEIIQIENERKDCSNYLSKLHIQWELECSQLKELRYLKNESEDLKIAIEEAELIGDLEEAARLKYDQLNQVESSVKDLENLISEYKISGKYLIKDEVDEEDIADVVARLTGIPVQRVLAGERQKLLNLEKELSQRVMGQEEAVAAIAAAIRRARAGMKDPRRPVGSFLFLGPTGVGKTELAKALAASLFDEEEALLRLDMSEFMERNAVARLLGAPPGYVGYEEGGQLTEVVRSRPYAVLLLDEIEKAHPDVFNLLLQVLDDGRLTDSQGRLIDFRHTVIVMTSNLASREILDQAKSLINEEINTDKDKLNQQIDEALTKRFRPEFINRIDEVIRFKPLRKEDLKQIVRLNIDDLSNLLSEQGLELRVDDEIIEQLARDGYEPEYGARPLRRVLRRKLENPLATQLLEEKFNGMRAVRVSASEHDSKLLIFDGEN